MSTSSIYNYDYAHPKVTQNTAGPLPKKKVVRFDIPKRQDEPVSPDAPRPGSPLSGPYPFPDLYDPSLPKAPPPTPRLPCIPLPDVSDFIPSRSRVGLVPDCLLDCNFVQLPLGDPTIPPPSLYRDPQYSASTQEPGSKVQSVDATIIHNQRRIRPSPSRSRLRSRRAPNAPTYGQLDDSAGEM